MVFINSFTTNSAIEAVTKKYVLSDMKVNIILIPWLNFYVIYNMLLHLSFFKAFIFYQGFHFLSRLSFKNSQLTFWLQKCFGWQKSIMHFKHKIFLSCYFKQTFFKYAVSQNVILNFLSHIYTILRNIS